MEHILVVDDTEAIAYLFRKYFERQGFRVSTATKGKQALTIAQSDPIDGLITDYRMPDMNGEELVTLLRQNNPDLPVIFASAFTSDIAPENKNTKVFSKPMEPMEVVRRMSDMLVDAETIRQMRPKD